MATPTPLRRRRWPFSVGIGGVGIVSGVAVVLGGLLLASPAAADAGVPSGAVLDQHFDSPVTSCGGQGSMVGESFTAGITGGLAQLRVPSQNAAASLFATRNGIPNGTPLAVANLVDGVATLSTPLPVVAGVSYAFLLPANDSAACAGTTSNPRQGVLSGEADGSGFTVDHSGQLSFQSYVIPLPTVAAKNLSVTAQTQLLTLVADQTTQTADTYSIVTQPSHGTATVEFDNTSIFYRSDPGYTGADSFTYTANTASGPSQAGTVSVTVAKTVANQGNQASQGGSSGSTSSKGQGGSPGSASSARATNAPSSVAVASGAATTSPTPLASSIATTPTSAGGLNPLLVGIIVVIVLLLAAAAVLVILLLRRNGLA